jgi:hypothetical protein
MRCRRTMPDRVKAFSFRALFAVLTVTCTGSVLADDPVEVLSERLDVFLVPKAGQEEFVVAHTNEEFTTMQQLYAPSVQLSKPRPPPVVDFRKRIVVAYFWHDFPCQPYRIGRVLQYPDRVTVEIIHRVMGKNCLCDASSMAAAAAVSIPRVDKRIDYIIKPEEGASCQYLPSTRSTNPRGSPYQLPPAGVPTV